MGGRGCLSLYGTAKTNHRLIAEHIAASEYSARTEGRGRVVHEWKAKPSHPDNHWLDCLVGCAAAASMDGISLEGSGPAVQVRQRRKVRIADRKRVYR